MKCIALLATIISLIVSQPANSATRQLTAAEKKTVSDTFGRALKDPQSAQYDFQPVFLAELTKRPKMAYCFSVNAKNALGGYVGRKTIVSTLLVRNGQIVGFEYIMGLNDDTPVLREITSDLCKRFGFRI